MPSFVSGLQCALTERDLRISDMLETRQSELVVSGTRYSSSYTKLHNQLSIERRCLAASASMRQIENPAVTGVIEWQAEFTEIVCIIVSKKYEE